MGLIKAFNLQPYTGRLLVPGEEPVEGSTLVMAVGNNRLAGGGFEVAPKARLDDGRNVAVSGSRLCRHKFRGQRRHGGAAFSQLTRYGGNQLVREAAQRTIPLTPGRRQVPWYLLYPTSVYESN